MQKVEIIGNIGRDGELKYAPNGNAVLTFSLASTRRYKDANGDQKSETVWFRAALWGTRAQSLVKYLVKGQQVYVEGSLVADESGSPRIWQGQDGKSRASFEVRVREIEFVGKKREAEQSEESEQTEQTDF